MSFRSSNFQALLSIPLAVSLFLSLSIAQDAEGAKGRRRGGGGGGGGGVILRTPNPTNPLEHNNRGVELGSKGLWPDAIREHELAVEGDPYRSDFRTNLSAAHMEYGKVLLGRGRSYEAMAQFRKAMIVDPANAQADQYLDDALRKTKKDPWDISVRRKIAIDADVNQDYDTAIIEWSKCVKMQDSGMNHAELGRAYLKAGKKREGYKELRIAVAKEWPRDEVLELAACHRQLGDVLKEQAFVAKGSGRGTVGMKRLANAAIEYRRAIQLNPGDVSAARGLLECAREAVAIRPNSFDNHLALGSAYLLNGDFAHARQEYEQCFRIDPRRPEVDQARVAYHQSVARSSLASDELVAQSVDKVKGLIDQNPENARLFYILGRLRERQAQPDLALKCYNKAWSINKHIDPDLPQAYVRLGQANPDGYMGPIAKAQELSEEERKKQEQAKLEELKKLEIEKQYLSLENLLAESKYDDVISTGQDMFAKNNKDGRVACLIGTAHDKKGSLDDAKVWYRLAAGLGDKNAEGFLDQLDAARAKPKLDEAEGFIGQQDWVKAASSLRDAIVLAPKRADLRRKLADVLNKMGDKEGAQKELEEANKLERPEGPPKKQAAEGANL